MGFDIVLHDLNRHLDKQDKEDERQEAIERELEWLRGEFPMATVGHMPIDCPNCGQRNIAGDNEFFVLRFVDSEITATRAGIKKCLKLQSKRLTKMRESITTVAVIMAIGLASRLLALTL